METHQTDLEGLRVVVNTQTPLIRFREGSLKKSGPVPLDSLEEGVDYKLTTGGVTRMLLPLLNRWLEDGTLEEAEWVAMGADATDRRIEHEGLHLSFVGLPSQEKKGYAQVKEKLWALLNSNPTTTAPRGDAGVPDEAWESFERYQARSARALESAADRMDGVDLLYIHDFQQVGVAEAWEGADVPRVFHLHTPFPTGIPHAWAEWFVGRLQHYDAVVVSTNRYATNLQSMGLDVPVHVIPPFIDPADFSLPTRGQIEEFRAQFGLNETQRVILNVGRMDPMKGQDRLLRALPRVLEREPEAHLVLVGNGSFSSAKKGGLGLSKGERWRAHLEELTDELGVGDHVTFTGHLKDELLPAAYSVCDVFCLPSTREGFGLAAIEAWRHRKPVVVSERAGVSELVENGVNGCTVDAADHEALADALADILLDPNADELGQAGQKASEQATLPLGRDLLQRVFAKVLEVSPHART